MADHTPPALKATGILKRFGSVVANRNASLLVECGEIHAVVGENGAGKSTLMRVLAGMHHPDAGQVWVNSREVTGWTTNQAIAGGVGMVHQHFMLVPTLTVAENLVLGAEPVDGVRLDVAAAREAVRTLSAESGLKVDPDRLVAELSVGELQRVEILKVMYRGAKILILDEPTAVLSPPEVKEFWKVLRGLVAAGGTVVLITHKLDEVAEISDKITVMRAGETVGALSTKGSTPSDIARMMVGRDVRLALDHVESAVTSNPATVRQPALAVRNLTVASSRKPNEVDGVSFELYPGEIFGIAGVEGNGQTELLEALAGLRRASSGDVLLRGRAVLGESVRARSDAGLSHIPEDRHRRGLVLDYSIADNLVLGLQHRFSGRMSIDHGAVLANAGKQIESFDIRPATAELPVRALSGGNQQKVVVARELRGRDFSVLLAAQPTRGVDVGAIEFIHAQLRAARDDGKAVLLVSADLVEVLALADRVGVMFAGRLVATLPRAEANVGLLGEYMTGSGRAHGN